MPGTHAKRAGVMSAALPHAAAPPLAAPPAAAPLVTAADRIVELLLNDNSISAEQLKHARRVRDKLESPHSLLKVLQELHFIAQDEIRTVIRAHPQALRLGEILVELEYLRDADLRSALAQQAATQGQKRLGEILVDNHYISEQKLVEVLADLLGLPVLEPRLSDIDKTVIARITPRVCLDFGFLPIGVADGGVTVAFADPLNAAGKAAAQRMLGAAVLPAIARRAQINMVLTQIEQGVRSTQAVASEQTAIGYVNSIVSDALELGVSDIHIEPQKGRLRVRFRIDGAMVEHKDFERELAPSITSRLKILAGADIAERRRHQDGRIHFDASEVGDNVDIRASFYVTIHGEKIVLRVLNRKTELINIDNIGMGPKMLDRFRQDALDVPTGVVIITGPTGSGKTSTLYSCVDYLNNPDTSIITAEDPVEYVIEGISQCSINPKINLTFEETLRHIVRQDPDVIVLGEIRDRFSADTAIQAALTGHKVLTTFHTEDSIGGLLRLLNMDIEAFLISSTVVCVVAQRLIRRVCEHCAEAYQATPGDLRRLGVGTEDLRGAEFRFGRGCADCRYTGYRGRVCVFELLVLNEMVKDAILNRRTSYEIRRISVETSGLVTLIEDGLAKAARGITSLQEVMRDLPRAMKPRGLGEIRRLLGEI